MKDKATLKRHKEEIQDNMEEAQSNTCERQKKKMEDTHTNDVIPSEYNHILEQAMTEALPTSNNDNSAHHSWSEKQDKRLTDTVDQYSFQENTSQLLSEKKQKKVILRIGVPIIIRNKGEKENHISERKK
ncbi:uncharacterized protein TNIN_450081 [Trichonephila inaurata madagascariensis]|uniref:Uncharacterized protein n=1 Tax=Trichonephila inaurata madagascariensis TaxID=2747483 RepID=A0A8X6YBP7_9ARAC|nr:uncharacterized protein TNIN_450081 [Trichonephila inaurata madagascariensis]